MNVHYEWVVELVELVDDEEGDIVDIDHYPTYADVAQALRICTADKGHINRVALVKTTERGRGWAYVDLLGKLAPRFENAMGGDMGAVPVKYLKQFNA